MWSKICQFALFLAIPVFTLLDTALSADAVPGECLYRPLGALRPSNNETCLLSVINRHDRSLQKPTSLWMPFTYMPICTGTSAEAKKYCVYTSADFNGNSGVSFIARPDSISEFTRYVQNVTLTRRGEKYRHGRDELQDPDFPYEVKNLPGKGLGVVAKRPIIAGEMFIVSFAGIVIDQGLEMDVDPEVSQWERLRLYESAFLQLTDRERLLSMAASTGGNLYEDIMKTNGFGIKVGNRRYSGVFPEAARLNHACAPNSIARFSAQSLALEAVAIQEVAAGEELSISYIPVDLPSEIRSEILQEVYNFQCDCSLCSAPPKEKQMSDERRERIYTIKEMLKDRSLSYEDALEITRDFLSLVQEENLDFKLKQYYQDLMSTFFTLGDLELAIRFGEAALRRARELVSEEDEFQEAIGSNLVVLRRMLKSGRKRMVGGSKTPLVIP